jgi:RNA polymerase sigma-70 factor, ECF subfamily
MGDGRGDGVEGLIVRARAGDGEALGMLLDCHRAELMGLARRHLAPGLAGRLDPSDVVQQAFLEAAQGFALFRGGSGAELAAWLRRILEFGLANVARDHLVTAKRAAGREMSMNAPYGVRSVIGERLPSADTSPSLRASRLEQAARLLAALASIPADQREAVRLRHIEGWPLERIADTLERSPEAAAGLIKRGVKALRDRLKTAEEDG